MTVYGCFLNMKSFNVRLFLMAALPVLLMSGAVSAQDGHDAFAFLRLPVSTRVSALGGHNISVVEAEQLLVFHNPALLGGETDGWLSAGYLNYISDVNAGSAIFTRVAGQRGAWGAGITYFNYGDFKETSVDNVELGTFSMQDVAVHGFYSYDLSDSWRGGLSLKFLYSTLADYTSTGLAVDAGLSYFDAERDMSLGIVLKNVGAQLKPYYEERQRVPWDLQVGFSRRLAHAPFRLSLTALYLNRWKLAYFDSSTIMNDDSFVETALKHIVFGLEFLPSNNLWIGAGLNPKTMADMKLATGNVLGGFSLGAGLKVSRFNVSVSAARYHPSAMSLMINAGISLFSSNL
jgi:hypothetical protein